MCIRYLHECLSRSHSDLYVVPSLPHTALGEAVSSGQSWSELPGQAQLL